MKKEEKATAVIVLAAVIVITAIIMAVALTFLFQQGVIGKKDPPENAATEYLRNLDINPDGTQCAVTTDGTRLYIDVQPDDHEGRIMFEALKGAWSCSIVSVETEKRNSNVTVNLECPGTQYIASAAREKLTERLSEAVGAASKASEVYDSNLRFRDDLFNSAYIESLSEACSQVRETDRVSLTAVLCLTYEDRQWKVTNPAVLTDTLGEKAHGIREEATADIGFIPISYRIDETAKEGPAPDQSAFGITQDKNVITQLLSTAYARNLIGGDELCWNENIELFPDTSIRYYLDESLLMLEWQEVGANMCATFGEVFTADGSQFRRKIAGDAFGDMHFMTTTGFAKQTNAVLAVGGDFYNHSRNCGISVFERQIYRFDPSTCDTCYVTSSGDMLFSYRNQFSDISEAQAFVALNDVVFSLGFGPVLIDNGVDVTPSNYTWGEVLDRYARSAIGMLGKNHYLTMNLNCGWSPYNNYATLRDAADVMVAKKCIKAYTLDGGQTSTVAVNGELVNFVEFGREKEISDIVYFATAVRN